MHGPKFSTSFEKWLERQFEAHFLPKLTERLHPN